MPYNACRLHTVTFHTRIFTVKGLYESIAEANLQQRPRSAALQQHKLTQQLQSPNEKKQHITLH